MEVVIQRLLLASSGALFLGSTGAFFLFVPLLSIMTVAWMLGGLMLMFGLGVQVGSPPKPKAGAAATPHF
jgi:hypothetical protein